MVNSFDGEICLLGERGMPIRNDVGRAIPVTSSFGRWATIGAVFLVSGCAAIEARNRSATEVDRREASVASDGAAVRLRATESARAAFFEVSTHATPCKDFKDVGMALSGWAEDEKPPKDIVELVPAGAPVQVRAFWRSFGGGMKLTCGPVVRQFTPKAGMKYMVRFDAQNQRCGLIITENSPTPEPVPSKSLVCSATLGEIL